MVHRTRTDLLPFYARLTAALGPCMPDVPSQLAGLLKQEPMQVKLFYLEDLVPRFFFHVGHISLGGVMISKICIGSGFEGS